MTAPMDEKGLEAATRAIKSPRCTCAYEDLASTAIRAYLAASPAPDGMEVVALVDDLRSVNARHEWFKANGLMQQAADAIDQAQSSLSAMAAERDEAQEAALSNFNSWKTAVGHVAAAEAQVLRLTEEKEALRNMADGYGKLDADYAISERRAEAAEASIKALEEALRPFAEHIVGNETPERFWDLPIHTHEAHEVTIRDFRRAITALSQGGGE
jgi:phage I-like protein